MNTAQVLAANPHYEHKLETEGKLFDWSDDVWIQPRSKHTAESDEEYDEFLRRCAKAMPLEPGAGVLAMYPAESLRITKVVESLGTLDISYGII